MKQNRKHRLFTQARTDKILNKVTAVSDTSLNNLAETSILAQQQQLSLSDILDNEALTRYRTISCNKTGRLLRTVSDDELKLLCSIHTDYEARMRSLKLVSLGHIHPAWLQTDGASLHQLQMNDPVGYCVYTMSLILQPDEFTTDEARYDAQGQKATAFTNLSNIPFHTIIHINELNHRYLNFLKHEDFIRFMHNTGKSFANWTASPENLADYMKQVKASLHKVILRYTDKTRQDEYAATQSALKLMQTHHAGRSNFREQSKSANKASRFDLLLGDLFDAYDDLQGLDVIVRKTTSQATGFAQVTTDEDRTQQATDAKAKTQALHKQAVKLQSRQQPTGAKPAYVVTKATTFSFTKKTKKD